MKFKLAGLSFFILASYILIAFLPEKRTLPE